MSQAALDAPRPVAPRVREVLNPQLALLLVVDGLRAVANYMLTPFLALYFHLALGFSLPLAGLLAGLPFLSGWLLGVVGGYLADRLGLVRSYAVGGVLTALTVAAMGLVHAVLPLAVILVIFGALRPVGRSAIDALANQSTKPEHRGLVQNYLYWISNVGVMVGLLVAAEVLAAGHSATPLFVVAALLALLVVPIYAGFARRDQGRSGPGDASAAPKGFGAAMATLARDRALLLGALAMLSAILVEAQLNATVPLDLTRHFANGPQLLGPLLAIDTVMVVAFQPLVGKYLGRLRPTRMFLAGALLGAAALALGGLANSVGVWVAAMVLYGLGEILWATQINQLLGELPLPGREALYFSVVGMAQYSAMFLGLTLGPTLLRGAPDVLWGGLIVVAAAGSWAFWGSTGALRQRQLATPDVQVRAPGFEEPAAATELAAVPMFQGGGAILPVARVSETAIFGVPVHTTPIVFLEALAPSEWDRVWSYGSTEDVAAGEMLVEAGAADRTVYLLESGELDVLVSSADGGEQRLTQLLAGSVFGEQAFLDGLPRSASIRAGTACRVRELSWEGFQSLSAHEPALAQTVLLDLARVVSERLRRTTQAMNLLRSA